MTWNWTKYMNHRTSEAIQYPSRFAFGATLLGFVAGAEGMDFARNPHHSFMVVVMDYLMVVVFATLALWQSYLLARAIRRLRDGGRPAAH
jgi:hypothetical protein